MESQLEQSSSLLLYKQQALAASENEQLRAELADVYAKLRQERLEDNESTPFAAAVTDVSVSSKGEKKNHDSLHTERIKISLTFFSTLTLYANAWSLVAHRTLIASVSSPVALYSILAPAPALDAA